MLRPRGFHDKVVFEVVFEVVLFLKTRSENRSKTTSKTVSTPVMKHPNLSLADCTNRSLEGFLCYDDLLSIFPYKPFLLTSSHSL
jgi:hypothetical protein